MFRVVILFIIETGTLTLLLCIRIFLTMCPYSLKIINPRYKGYSRDELAALSNYWSGLRGEYDPLADYAYILRVPCGKCEYCIRRKRSDLYVRAMAEYIDALRFNAFTNPPVFLTCTLSDAVLQSYYDEKDEEFKPSKIVRDFRETARKRGYKLRAMYVPELSPEKKRLHFHGLLFNPPSYSILHGLFRSFGWLWIRPASPASIGYILKYIVKDADKGFRPYLPIHFGANLSSLGVFDGESGGVDFVGSNGRKYHYRIPLYYRRYFVDEKKKYRQILSTIFAHVESLPNSELESVRIQLAASYLGVPLSSDYVIKDAPPALIRAMRKSVESNLVPLGNNKFTDYAEFCNFNSLTNETN